MNDTARPTTEIHEFEVLTEESAQSDFLFLKNPDGGEPLKLKKLLFQTLEPVPERLICRVKDAGSDGWTVEHYLPQYVRHFYHEQYRTGSACKLEVVSAQKRGDDTIVLTDPHGIIYRVHDRKALVSEGQQVECVFTALTDTRFSLRLVDDNLALPFISIEELKEELHIPCVMAAFLVRFMQRNDVFAETAAEYAVKNPRWILTALQVIEKHLDEWFVAVNVDRNRTVANYLINLYRDGALWLLEGSHFMNNLDRERRDNLRSRLTEIVESGEPVSHTISVLNEGQQYEFVKRLMVKLSKSGYLYHPTLQLSVMMLIFRMYPEMVDASLSLVFDAIMGRDLKNWTEEPFRSAFVDQFEVYLRQQRPIIDDLPPVDTPREKHAIETIVTAIALQLFIADPDQFEAYQSNSSLFYRCVALLQPFKADDLLTKSLLTALGQPVAMNFDYDAIKSPMMMMTAASVMAHSTQISSLITAYVYETPWLRIVIDNRGLSIVSLSDERMQQLIPGGMMPWLSPRIFGPKMQAPHSTLLVDRMRWWRELENTLTRLADAAHNRAASRLRAAEIGEDVMVRLLHFDNPGDGNPVIYCSIDDEGIIPSRGSIDRNQIVGFKVSSVPRDIFSPKATDNIRYRARVIGIDPDGSYRFSLLEDIREWLSDNVNYNDEYRGVIAGRASRGYSAISDEGFGLFLDIIPDEPTYNSGDKVRFRVREIAPDGTISGVITGELDSMEIIDKNTAFSNILHALAYEREVDEQTVMLSSELPEEQISADTVGEIIDILRFHTNSASSLAEAYDYLSMAHIMALAIEDKDRAHKIETHQSLLMMYEYFAKNSVVDTEELKRIVPSCPKGSELGRMHERLALLSQIGKSEEACDKQLIDRYCNDNSGTVPSLEQTIARMVSSYNLLNSADPTQHQLLEGILERIKKLLNVSNAAALKYYGSESLYVEFKSSTVFPAGAKSEADPQRQQFTILKVINSFLNAGGGTLYIGVNDSTHYECGLHDDFEYYTHNSVQFGPYTNRIRNLDNLCVSLANLVNHTFGNSIGRLVEIASDDDSSKDVIVVKVKQSLTPVKLNDTYYERQSSSIRELSSASDRQRFEAERKSLYDAAMMRISAESTKAADDVPAVEGSKAPAQLSLTPLSEPSDAPVAQTISTSRWRPNVLHEYENNYVDPVAWLYFSPDGHIKISQTDRYEENDNLLTLVVTHSDVEKQASLVLVFEGEKMLRMPVSALIEEHDGTVLAYDDATPLQFAAIAHPADGVLSIINDSSKSLWQRVTPVADIAEGNIASAPHRVLEAAAEATYLCDIVAAGSMPLFVKSLGSELKPRAIGFAMRRKIGGEHTAEAIDNLIQQCHNNAE